MANEDPWTSTNSNQTAPRQRLDAPSPAKSARTKSVLTRSFEFAQGVGADNSTRCRHRSLPEKGISVPQARVCAVPPNRTGNYLLAGRRGQRAWLRGPFGEVASPSDRNRGRCSGVAQVVPACKVVVPTVGLVATQSKRLCGAAAKPPMCAYRFGGRLGTIAKEPLNKVRGDASHGRAAQNQARTRSLLERESGPQPAPGQAMRQTWCGYDGPGRTDSAPP